MEPTIVPTSTTEPANGRRRLVAALGLIVSLLSVVLVARTVDIGEAARILGSASIGPLLLAEGAYLVGLGLRITIWRVLLPDRPDGSRVTATRLTPVLLVSLLGNLLLPARLGEVVGAYLISRRENLALGAAFGAVALQRIIDTATLAVIAFLAAAAAASAAWVLQGTGLLAAAGIVLLLALSTTGLAPLVRAFGRFGRGALLRGPVSAVVVRLDRFVYWSGGAHRRRAIGLTLGLSALTWIWNAVMFWLVGLAIGAPLSAAGALLVMSVAVLSTAIPSAPAYVGTFELAAVTVAASLGVPGGPALALAVLAHVLSLLPTAIGGSVALASLGGGMRSLSVAAAEERRLQADAS
jgi:glycosyltransferase 2 family protein